MDPEIPEAVSLEFYLILLYQTYNIDYAPNIQSSNSELLRFKVSWWIEIMEQLQLNSYWIWALRLIFRSWLRSSWLMMHMFQRFWTIGNHGSPKWNLGIWFTISSFSPPIAWGASLLHTSCYNLSLSRLKHWQLQQFSVCCVNLALAWTLRLYPLKLNGKVDCADPLWWIFLWKLLPPCITH